MIDWKDTSYGIRLPGFQVFDRKTNKTVKVCNTPHDAKAEIERLMRKEKK